MERSYLRLFIMVIAARDIQIARMLAVFVWGPRSSNSNQYRLSISKMQQGLRSRQPGGTGEGTGGRGCRRAHKGWGGRAIKHNVKFEDCKSLLDGHRMDRLLSQFLQKMGFKGPSKGGSIVLQFDKG